ncbi:MAG: family 43 glycosylhydrolase [Lachnospiraceae bacterium]|nr:family 43 glycosylhydrolase [Lachnospiraceae bacterium]MBQ9123157.1 family 43 glycosylhydrolase [Lachnospiraceae bacterium]
MKYTNPVIRGFYPDPSICYAEGYYYLVCSTFQFFPGIPVFRSANLVDWETVGYCMTRKSQLDLTKMGASGGIFAPTIRYHKGRFYVVCTNVGGYGNFMVYTDDIEGEWSEPILLDRPGIDPSLLFDEDKVYFISNGDDGSGREGVLVCEMDIETGKLLTESKLISQGTGGRYLEGPHLYKIGEYYYLLAAEGGTEYGHMECLHRSKDIYGPYEMCPWNPILTNRNLGGYFIQGSGHADIVEGENGQWWMVHLAFRQMDRWRPFHQMGRETFLVPITWTEDGWFRVGTDGTCRAAYEVTDGKIASYMTADYPTEKWSIRPEEAIFLRCPDFGKYQLCLMEEETKCVYLKPCLAKGLKKGQFKLYGTTDTLNSLGDVTFVGMRQREFETTFALSLDCGTMLVGQKVGMTAYMTETDYFDLQVEKISNRQGTVTCKLVIGGLVAPLGNQDVTLSDEQTKLNLKIETRHQSYAGYLQVNGKWEELGQIEAKLLTSEVVEGFTGVILAAYAEANEQGESGWVSFEEI